MSASRECTVFTIFDSAETLKAENVKKSVEVTHKIIVLTKDNKLYSCGYGTPALCEDENSSIEN